MNTNLKNKTTANVSFNTSLENLENAISDLHIELIDKQRNALDSFSDQEMSNFRSEKVQNYMDMRMKQYTLHLMEKFIKEMKG